MLFPFVQPIDSTKRQWFATLECQICDSQRLPFRCKTFPTSELSALSMATLNLQALARLPSLQIVLPASHRLEFPPTLILQTSSIVVHLSNCGLSGEVWTIVEEKPSILPSKCCHLLLMSDDH